LADDDQSVDLIAVDAANPVAMTMIFEYAVDAFPLRYSQHRIGGIALNNLVQFAFSFGFGAKGGYSAAQLFTSFLLFTKIRMYPFLPFGSPLVESMVTGQGVHASAYLLLFFNGSFAVWTYLCINVIQVSRKRFGYFLVS